MDINNLNLKKCLIFQSFAPLFLLLTIKYLDITLYNELVCKFVAEFEINGLAALLQSIKHPSFGAFVVFVISICWVILALLFTLGFNAMQKNGFKSAGEQIEVVELENDGSATFIVTYIVPLFTTTLVTLRDLIIFLTMLLMIILILVNSKSFYRNPILALLKYKTFKFRFRNPDSDIQKPNSICIGITRGNEINEDEIIKRKYISDDVFLIYN